MDLHDDIYPRRKESPKTISGKLWWLLKKYAHNTKIFILRNKSSIDILFIVIYLIEQALFVYFMFTAKYSVKSLATIFILVLMSTMAIERVLMELRYTTLNKQINILTRTLKEALANYKAVLGKIKLK